jgi:hypothetical protein
VPWDLTIAIEHANRVLDWHENLMEDELPPEWMWPLDNEIASWFEGVKRQRDEKFGTSSSNGDREVDMMMDNELARGRR